MNSLEKIFFRSIIYLVVTLNLYIFTGCNEQDEKRDSVGAGPTIEDMTDLSNDKEKSEIIKDAIKMSEDIMRKIDQIKGIDRSMVFINHEAVLVATKLEDKIDLTESLRNEIENKVYDTYKDAKTIAISDDEYVYESISRLLKSYKENDPIGELLKDLREILNSLK